MALAPPNTAALVSNCYDYGCSASALPGTPPACTPGLLGTPGLCEHDNANYPPTFTYRGNVTSSTTLTAATTNFYDAYGAGSMATTQVNGVTTSVTPNNSFAAPSQLTTGSLTSSMTWSSFLGLNSATGPNLDTGSIGYDANARPASTTSPYGAVTTFTYNDTASPPNKVAMTDLHGAQTIMDGFGRTNYTVNGYGTNTGISTAVSTVHTTYTPCGCSPLGKLYQQSQTLPAGWNTGLQ